MSPGGCATPRPIHPPAISHHLKLLRQAGLIASERRGTWVYYRLGARRLREPAADGAAPCS
ncbi:metalloregulator ArsR/SmtB family transcription factor, partial [Streptomyces albidoflavus]